MQNSKEKSKTKNIDFFIDVMTIADLNQVIEIEKMTFPSPWSRDNFLFELKKNRAAHSFVIRNRGKREEIVGFTCTWILFGELKINNIAIKEEYRKIGLGTWFMDYLIDFAFQKGCDSATLEVRSSNEAALRLYRKLGFKMSGLRRGYYSDNGEDAYIMSLDINERMSKPREQQYLE